MKLYTESAPFCKAHPFERTFHHSVHACICSKKQSSFAISWASSELKSVLEKKILLMPFCKMERMHNDIDLTLRLA